jgi:ATP-dependent protease ClpP protease subunit
MAASMAGILLQAGDTRVMAKESWLMIHEASFGASGKIGDVEDTVEWVKMVQERILSIFSERSGLTKAFLKKNWQRKNWWISSDYALKLNLIDEVR